MRETFLLMLVSIEIYLILLKEEYADLGTRQKINS
jgi:hypothetical protein